MAYNFGTNQYFGGSQQAPMFPQPNGNVYLIQNSLEVANVPAGAEATQTSESTTDIAHLSFTTLVRVLPNCCAITNNNPLTLTVVNTGIATTVSNAAMTVVKVK